MDLIALKEKLKDKLFLSYTMIGLAALVYTTKLLFKGKKSYQRDERLNKRRKVAHRLKKLFNYEELSVNSKLKIIDNQPSQVEHKVSKLQDFTKSMIEKVYIKEELKKGANKQDYIFYQILGSMQNRFKPQQNPIIMN